MSQDDDRNIAAIIAPVVAFTAFSILIFVILIVVIVRARRRVSFICFLGILEQLVNKMQFLPPNFFESKLCISLTFHKKQSIKLDLHSSNWVLAAKNQ
jgi:hypothetical protein